MTQRRKDGDGCFREVFIRYKDRVYDFALKLTGDTDTAGDVTQEVFLRIYKQLTQGHRIEHPRRWLFISARNLCLNTMRNERHTTTLAEADFAATADGPESPEVMLLRKALHQLDPNDREVLILKEYQGFTYREMAAILECTIPALRSRLYEARKRLRDIYSRLCKRGANYDM